LEHVIEDVKSTGQELLQITNVLISFVKTLTILCERNTFLDKFLECKSQIRGQAAEEQNYVLIEVINHILSYIKTKYNGSRDNL
jgi:hypothetical protein